MRPEDQDRDRLARTYTDMSEAALQRMAAQAAELTDVARKALADEIARRGLDIPLAAYRPEDEIEFQDLVTIKTFRDLPDALLAKGMLESAGIECYLADDETIRMAWVWSNLLGHIKLQVKPEDADAAGEVLNQPIPEGFDAEPAGTYQQPKCPECASLDVTFQSLDKSIAYASVLVGLPLPVIRDAWKCEACGHSWAAAPPSGIQDRH